MFEHLQTFFDGGYMPNGYCCLWFPSVLWAVFISDLVVAISCFSIPFALLAIVKKRPEWKFRGVFILFAAFILFFGIAHLFSIITMWYGTYGWHAVAKVCTAIASFFCVVFLYKNFNHILALPTPQELREANVEAQNQAIKRIEVESRRKADAIFRFTTELVPTGLLVIDEHQNIILANRALEALFEYNHDELIGVKLGALLGGEHASHHGTLVKAFMDNPVQKHAVASGRVVRGKTKSGGRVTIEISLSVHEFDGVKHAFASVVNVASFLSEKNMQEDRSNRIRRAINATNDGIWEWNIESGHVWYSQNLMVMIGRNPEEEPKLEYWQAHIHPDDKSMVETCLANHFDSKNKFEVVYRGLTQAGSYEWVHSRGDTLFDEDGAPLLMSGTLTNIHQQTILRDQLDEKSRFLNQILTRSLSGIYIFDLTKQCNVYINPEYSKLTGYTLEELNALQSSDSLLPLFHPEDQERINLHFAEVIEKNKDDGVPIEYRFRHKDGHWMWCYSRDSIYSYDKDGNPKEMLGAFFDISELKERENQIQLLARDFSTTFEQAAVGIAHVGLTGHFIKVNRKLCEILGYEPDTLLRKSVIDLSLDEDKEHSDALLKDLISGSVQQVTVEKRYIRADGHVIWVLLTVAVVMEEHNSAGYFIAVIEDISARKNMESALRDSNAALERFAYSASHDLQEPLRKISAFAGMLETSLTEKLDDKESLYQLQRIADAARRMSEMIRSLLQLSRYSQQPFVVERWQFSELLNVAKEDLAHLLSGYPNAIRLHGDAPIDVEPTGFQQVIRNLLSNSVRYAQDGVPLIIDITVSEQPREVKLCFKDNGTGFKAAMAEQIFEPFRRLVGRTIPGTGMGLAICLQIINKHGGKITATSDGEGKGAVFTIVLPKGGANDG